MTVVLQKKKKQEPPRSETGFSVELHIPTTVTSLSAISIPHIRMYKGNTLLVGNSGTIFIRYSRQYSTVNNLIATLMSCFAANNEVDNQGNKIT